MLFTLENLLFTLISCIYIITSHAKHIDGTHRQHRKQRYTEDSYVDLTLSYNNQNNNIVITTEEPNIWWPWANYEEWKRANTGETFTKDTTTEEITTTSTESTTTAKYNEIKERRKHNKRSKKNDEKIQKRKKKKEEQRRKNREEREKRKRERLWLKNRKMSKRLNHNYNYADVDMEDAMWAFLNSKSFNFQNDWDYLNDEAFNDCSNEIEFCKPKCLVFIKTASYICSCPRHHELIMEENKCRRK